MKKHSPGFYAGISLGVALFFLRAVPATTYGELVFAAALTLVEFSVVWMWETHTVANGRALHHWNVKQAERNRKRGADEAAAAHLADRQKDVDDTEAALAALDHEFAAVHLLADRKALITIATNAVEAGYQAGISDNRGRVDGAADLGGNDDE